MQCVAQYSQWSRVFGRVLSDLSPRDRQRKYSLSVFVAVLLCWQPQINTDVLLISLDLEAQNWQQLLWTTMPWSRTCLTYTSFSYKFAWYPSCNDGAKLEKVGITSYYHRQCMVTALHFRWHRLCHGQWIENEKKLLTNSICQCGIDGFRRRGHFLLLFHPLYPHIILFFMYIPPFPPFMLPFI